MKNTMNVKALVKEYTTVSSRNAYLSRSLENLTTEHGNGWVTDETYTIESEKIRAEQYTLSERIWDIEKMLRTLKGSKYVNKLVLKTYKKRVKKRGF